ncbi:MAG: hypothetical protein WCI46_11105 [Verrucomicrobiota bacterium]
MLKSLDLWLPSWIKRPKREPVQGVEHLLITVCDHFEPFHGVEAPHALARVKQWHRDFTPITAEFHDSNGQPPKHTFFYPIEQYHPQVLQALAELCSATKSETEIHLHHDRDHADNLRLTLNQGMENFAKHGLLSRDSTGKIRYGFIHGNWALDNSHPTGQNCGVTNELQVLIDTGCYADFTMPSAPHPTQTQTINSLYYAQASTTPKSHNHGRPVRALPHHQPASPDELLIVQGPLALNWNRRKYGILPRIENSDLTGANPPTINRLRVWQKAGITVKGCPNWTFIKLHTHGANPKNSPMLLGQPMRQFHQSLRQLADTHPHLHFHYLTAREMVNVLHAAEQGHSDNPHLYRDHCYRLPPPPLS